jgi:glycosyltransferase involved in cell wall biosynthesis
MPASFISPSRLLRWRALSATGGGKAITRRHPDWPGLGQDRIFFLTGNLVYTIPATGMISNTPIIKKKRSREQPRFSILIPSWNNLDYLRLCVESIRQNSHFTHQIIVHVNEGKDGTLDWLESEADLDYTFSRENIGICYALNLGRELARADYLVYMNDDMYVCPDWDRELLAQINQAGTNFFFFSATAIEPVFTNNPCCVVKDCGRDIKGFREQELLKEFSTPVLDDWQGATWPPNVVHKDLWDLVGGYSPEFSPGMYSDPDFSMKLWKLGVRLFKGIGKSRVYHFGSKSTKRVPLNEGYYTFFSKWGMSSGTFSKYFLRRGEKFDGPLGEPRFSKAVRLRNFIKRTQLIFRR